MQKFWYRYRKVIIIFLLIKLTLVLAIVFFRTSIPFDNHEFLRNHHGNNQGVSRSQDQAQILSFWDGQWYQEIADIGYRKFYPLHANYAFFPLYPLVLKITSMFFFGNIYVAGIFLSFLFSFLATIFLYKLFLLETEKSQAQNGVLLFLLYPAAIFYLALYNESIFLFLSLVSIYAARKRQWWTTGLVGFLAALVRPQGVLLLIPVGIEYIIALKENGRINGIKGWAKKIFSQGAGMALLLIPLGLGVFFLYSFYTTGNFFAPLDAQRFFSRSEMSFLNIGKVLWKGVTQFSQLAWFDFRFSRIDFLVSIFSLGLLVPIFRRLRLSYAFYALALIFLPLSSGVTMSLTRFVSLSFPHFLLLGMLTKERRYLTVLLGGVFLVLAIIFALRFVNFYWVS
jgi:hypothetical protein